MNSPLRTHANTESDKQLKEEEIDSRVQEMTTTLTRKAVTTTRNGKHGTNATRPSTSQASLHSSYSSVIHDAKNVNTGNTGNNSSELMNGSLLRSSTSINNIDSASALPVQRPSTSPTRLSRSNMGTVEDGTSMLGLTMNNDLDEEAQAQFTNSEGDNPMNITDLSLKTAKLLEMRMRYAKNAQRSDNELDHLLAGGVLGTTVTLSLNESQALLEERREQQQKAHNKNVLKRAEIWEGYKRNVSLSRPMQAAYAELYPELYKKEVVSTDELSAMLYPNRLPAQLMVPSPEGRQQERESRLSQSGLRGGK